MSPHHLSHPLPSSSSAASSSPSPKGTTSGDAERDCSEPPESLPSAGAWDFSGEPVPDSSPEPDPDELELPEPDALPETLPDPELESEGEELDLEPREQWSGDGEVQGECDGLCGTRE